MGSTTSLSQRDLSVVKAYGKCSNPKLSKGHHKSWLSADGKTCTFRATCNKPWVPNRTKYPKIAEHLNMTKIQPNKVIALLDERIHNFKETRVSLDNQIEAGTNYIKEQGKAGWTQPCLSYYCDNGWVRSYGVKKPCPQCKGKRIDDATDIRWKRDAMKTEIKRLEKERDDLFEVTLDKLEAMLEKDDNIVPKPIEANLADPKSVLVCLTPMLAEKRKLNDAIDTSCAGSGCSNTRKKNCSNKMCRACCPGCKAQGHHPGQSHWSGPRGARRLPELPCAAAVPAAAGTDHAPLLCMSAVFLLFMIFVRRWTAKRY